MEVPPAEAAHLGERHAKVCGEPFDHLGAVGLGVLAIEDQPTKPPVQHDQFPDDGKRGSRPRRLNFRPHSFEQKGVATHLEFRHVTTLLSPGDFEERQAGTRSLRHTTAPTDKIAGAEWTRWTSGWTTLAVGHFGRP